MRTIRIDVDTQVGFADPAGHLFVPTDDTVLSNIRALIAHSSNVNIPVLGSVDSHAHDAWEFIDNGGPFPAHCVKGTSDWLKVDGTLPARFRFVPMSTGGVVVGENSPGSGNRSYGPTECVAEATNGVGIYFEKEVYSAFANPNAEPMIEALVDALGGPDAVEFQVFGYCTGGFCVDAFCTGLIARGYAVSLILDATAAIDTPDNGGDGRAHSATILAASGVRIIDTATALEVTA